MLDRGREAISLSRAEFEQLRLLEGDNQERALVLGASQLDIELLPVLYDTLCGIGHVPCLNVIVYCRGGEVNVARRIALLMHEFTERLRFIVPYHCESAATVMVLAAHEIVAGPLAIFSPIDPHLNGSDPEGVVTALSAQDIRMFSTMAQNWFGLNDHQARERALSLLCDSIAPASLTAFYRSALGVCQIGEEMLALHLSHLPAAQRTAIVEALAFGYHSHDYALNGSDLARLGLPVCRDPILEAAAWSVVGELRTRIGPETRKTSERGWCDALIATCEGGQVRTRQQEALPGDWTSFGTSI